MWDVRALSVLPLIDVSTPAHSGFNAVLAHKTQPSNTRLEDIKQILRLCTSPPGSWQQ